MPQIFLPIDAISGGDAAFSARCDAMATRFRELSGGGRLPRQKPPLTQVRRSILAVSGGTTRRANAAELIRNI
jgi:hypothetical protein